ncbi:MAG TPA: recombinase family protein [Anaerovoracaceae bacterium]|nr:recombinase family protein [Anaerovoracaceae bacterium]
MKAGIYCRLSEEDRNKREKANASESIQNQKSMLLQYAMDQGWEVFGIYSDDDYTGVDRNRPEFNRLLQDAEQKKIDVVLCKTQSRFTREMELVEKYLHGLFPLWGIRFVSIVDNADTDNKGNKKARQINGLVNEWYLEEMSDNIKSVLTSRREQGFHIGSFSLYGYIKDPERKGHLIIDPEAAAVVRKIFGLYAEGYGKTAIARILNEEGIPNPAEYKRLKGIRLNPSQRPLAVLWKYYTISDMLHNEMYIGNMVQGKYGSISYKTKQNKPRSQAQWIRVENTHNPIINSELWCIVQRKLGSNYKSFSSDGKVGLFSKKVRCMDCGYSMRSSKTNGRHYLKCTTRHANKDACDGAFISVRLLETTVVSELNNLISQLLDIDYLERKISFPDQFEQEKALLQNEIASCEKKYEQFTRGVKSLYLDKVNGIISKEVFTELSEDFYENRKNLDKSIAEKRKLLKSMEAAQDNAFSKRQKIEKYTHITTLTRDMVEELIDSIRVGKKDPETGEREIEIYWCF